MGTLKQSQQGNAARPGNVKGKWHLAGTALGLWICGCDCGRHLTSIEISQSESMSPFRLFPNNLKCTEPTYWNKRFCFAQANKGTRYRSWKEESESHSESASETRIELMRLFKCSSVLASEMHRKLSQEITVRVKGYGTLRIYLGSCKCLPFPKVTSLHNHTIVLPMKILSILIFVSPRITQGLIGQLMPSCPD